MSDCPRQLHFMKSLRGCRQRVPTPLASKLLSISDLRRESLLSNNEANNKATSFRVHPHGSGCPRRNEAASPFNLDRHTS